jgi:hypothetical protein
MSKFKRSNFEIMKPVELKIRNKTCGIGIFFFFIFGQCATGKVDNKTNTNSTSPL